MSGKGSSVFRVWRTIGVGVVLSFYFFLLAPIGYASFAIWAALPTSDPRRRARRIQNCMRAAFASMHWALRWLRILDFNPKDVEGKIPEEPCILVGNHPTLVDISSVMALEPNLIFPAKASLFRTFWAGPMLKAADQLYILERDTFGVGQTVELAGERLAQGYRLIIFPEGTRSPADRLHPFGRMAFEIAVRENVPIVPLVIECEPRWLTPDRSFFSAEVKRVPKLKIRVLDPIHPKDLGEVQAEDGRRAKSRLLRDSVSERIHKELGLTLPER
ncbi:MAG: lysophospholipid acyltransferase family protein [Myxococcota bacterium]